jgi:opacity protein-like surface antigen
MKKITLASFTIVAALACQHAAAQSKFEGLSFSTGLGMAGASTTLSGSVISNEQAASGKIDFGKTSAVAVLDLGYGLRMNPDMVLGLGATYDIGNTKSGSISVNGMGLSGDLIKLVGKRHFSIYAQPTWLLTPDTGFFVKLGYHRMHRSQEGLLAGDLLAQGVSTSMNLSGVGYGLGVKTYISKNVFLQAEANTVSYSSKDLTSALSPLLGDIPPGDSASAAAKVKTTTGIVSIGMNF